MSCCNAFAELLWYIRFTIYRIAVQIGELPVSAVSVCVVDVGLKRI